MCQIFPKNSIQGFHPRLKPRKSKINLFFVDHLLVGDDKPRKTLLKYQRARFGEEEKVKTKVDSLGVEAY